MPFLLNYDLSLFLYSSRFILHIYSIEHSPLTWDPRFGYHKWMIFSVQSERKFISQSIFEIEVDRTSKMSALLWQDTLESNEGNGISFDIFFPDAAAIIDVFIKILDFLFLNVMR